MTGCIRRKSANLAVPRRREPPECHTLELRLCPAISILVGSASIRTIQ
jgi:hypothetical protein